MSSRNFFILAGNGPYGNRGCEAIVRGTVKILRECYSRPQFMCYSFFKERGAFEEQRARETDSAIEHAEIWGSRQRFDLPWFVTNILRRTYPSALRHLFYRRMKPHLAEARAVLAIGGDNLSLDYGGRPILCTELNDLVIDQAKPMILWGASVGPFSRDPAYEAYMARHLRRVTIFARESLTVEYLETLGITDNVIRVADPAFVMDAIEPNQAIGGPRVENGAIGINFSPLLANFVHGGNYSGWLQTAVKIVRAIAIRTNRPIYLIPHVTSALKGYDDFAFLRCIANELEREMLPLTLVSSTLNATELKYIIGKMEVFGGARMHATIAALSSCVPTLSFAYSMKSQGLNLDVFGHTHYCVTPRDLFPEYIAERFMELLKDSKDIRCELKNRIPRMKHLAMEAGYHLKRIVG